MFNKLLLASLTCCLVFSSVNMGAANAYTKNNTSQARINVQQVYKNAINLSIKGQLSKALAAYQSILRVDPNHAMAINNIGYIYSQQGKTDLAISYYQKAISIKPHDDTFHSNLAGCYARKGNYDQAIYEYNRALEIDPGSITVKTALDKVLQKSGKTNYHAPRNTYNNPTVSNVVPIYTPNYTVYPSYPYQNQYQYNYGR